MDENKKLPVPDDGEIIDGLRRHDSRITRDYFYGYCHVAYSIYNKRYQLSGKPGLDFYDVAHEYYIALSKHNFCQLEDRRANASLKTWMVNGFRYVLLDRMKAYKREFPMEDIVARANADSDVIDFVAVADDDFAADFHRSLSELCDAVEARNPRQGRIMRMLCIDGYKGKEVAQEMGITPAAVSQQFHKIMDTIVVPYFRGGDKRVVSVFSGHALSMPDMMESSSVAPSEYKEKTFNLKSIKAFIGKFTKLESRRVAEAEAEEEKKERSWRSHDVQPAPTRHKGRITPDKISSLAPGEVFVFGSNLAGFHGGGASLVAHSLFGAEIGNGDGPQGNSYAIPTMLGGVDAIRPYVDRFIRYAREHSDKTFLVIQIGCGVAGFYPDDIAPLFASAVDVENIHLPRSFWDCLDNQPLFDDLG